MTAAPAFRTTRVEVLDPDNCMAMPLFEGPVSEAGKRLIPGRYRAVLDTGVEVTVMVTAGVGVLIQPAAVL